MAIKQFSKEHPSNTQVVVIVWAGLAPGDVGEALPFSQYTEKSAQVVGDFGGATLEIQGSNNGANWHTLTDPQGNPLSFTQSKLEMVMEATRWVRPAVVGGALTDISVYLLIKE